jgi:hypothetical protein
MWPQLLEQWIHERERHGEKRHVRARDGGGVVGDFDRGRRYRPGRDGGASAVGIARTDDHLQSGVLESLSQPSALLT